MPLPEDLINECDAFIQEAYREIIAERDALRLRILRVDEEHEELVDLRNKLMAEVMRILGERDHYKRLYELRGKALARPCTQCGYVQAEVKVHEPG